jgi:glycosyltransferase involved in cell wall biosynthesis
MRIALYHNLPSGGAKRSVNEAVRRLVDRHHIDTYTLSCANHEFADIRPFVAKHVIYDFRPSPLFNSPFGRLNPLIRIMDVFRLDLLSQSIAKQVENEKYDVLLVYSCKYVNSPGLLRYVKNLRSVYFPQEPPRVLYETSPRRPYDLFKSVTRRALNRIDPLPYLYRKILRDTDRRNLRQADRVLVNSEFMRRSFDEIYQIRSQVSYHGVDTERFKPVEIARQDYFLSVGSLTPMKGFDFLIEAVAELPQKNSHALIIASNFQNPPEIEYLTSLANDRSVNLELLNNISDEKLVGLYNGARVTLYAPIREPFGLVPLESMACEIPVVGVREGGIPETVIEGKTGVLVERGAKEFAAALGGLIADPGLAREYGRNGREHVLRNWTWERAVNTLENHLCAA